jgi:hypothetical protein
MAGGVGAFDQLLDCLDMGMPCPRVTASCACLAASRYCALHLVARRPSVFDFFALLGPTLPLACRSGLLDLPAFRLDFFALLAPARFFLRAGAAFLTFLPFGFFALLTPLRFFLRAGLSFSTSTSSSCSLLRASSCAPERLSGPACLSTSTSSLSPPMNFTSWRANTSRRRHPSGTLPRQSQAQRRPAAQIRRPTRQPLRSHPGRQ